MDNSLIVDGLNITELSDEELLARLVTLGFNPGPILDTTREVYQRKLARLLRNEEFEDLEDENEPPNEENFPESPILNSSFESYSGSPSINIDDLRRRPLSRVEGEKWSEDPPILSPHKPWSPDDIVSQVKPPPEEEGKQFLSTTTIIFAVVAFMFFAFIVYYNMESTPKAPFS